MSIAEAAPGRPDQLVIAIDGPSGSGKSSTAKEVARRLGLQYLDTGAMYRAVAVAYRDDALTPNQAEETARRIREEWAFDFSTSPDTEHTEVNGVDVTDEIRTPFISAMVSQVATMIPVRRELQQRQRDIISASGKGIVVEGRDITTVVAPDADVRVLLVADPTARMARREAELRGQVTGADLADQVLRRDRDDATVSRFEEPADGVTLIDSTHLTLDEVVDRICALAAEA